MTCKLNMMIAIGKYKGHNSNNDNDGEFFETALKAISDRRVTRVYYS